MSFVACHEANKEKLCIECINYFRCRDREFNSCFFSDKEYWNQNIFVDELEEFCEDSDIMTNSVVDVDERIAEITNKPSTERS